MAVPSFDLDRFRRAQASTTAGITTAIAELGEGRKLTHWIWYIFPQLAGLGSSTMSRQYGLKGVAEARAFFRDARLRANLMAATGALEASVAGKPAHGLVEVLGAAIDLQKVVSSLTLFHGLAKHERIEAGDPASADFVARAERVLAQAETEGFPACRFTRRALASTIDR